MDDQLVNTNEESTRSSKKSKQTYISNIKDFNFTQLKKFRSLSNKYLTQIYDNTIYNTKQSIDFDVNFIEFQINHKILLGHNVFIAGSCETLGRWNAEKA
eukprot:TRINITY_DN7274_c0_g1_i11.p2 TRINITY_DN7274_c0_g1~~TRINITY_DN7274_c0_g1_i11.p2  ORF type:complete len:100 (+),score=24.21 TRINITY_DN7274_c0_g1_i11:151-450(+)